MVRVGWFYDEVPIAGVERDRPSIQETLVAEKTERESFVDDEVHLSLPAQVIEGLEHEIDCDRNSWPCPVHELDLLVGIRRQIGKLDTDQVTDPSWEHRSWRAGVDQRLRLGAPRRRADLDIHRGANNRGTAKEPLLLPPREGVCSVLWQLANPHDVAVTLGTDELHNKPLAPSVVHTMQI